MSCTKTPCDSVDGAHSGFRVGGWVPRSAGEICTLVAFVVAKRTSVQISLPGRHEPPTDQHTAVSTRVLAPRARYAEVVDVVSGLAGSLTIGDPLEASTQVGPLVSAR